jgi:type IV pilus assembly protein PilC
MGTMPQIPGGLDSLKKHSTGGRVGEALSIISSDIQSGNTISQAFQKHEQLFGTFFCSAIAQGETSQNPGNVLLKLSEYYENRYVFHNKLTRLLKYPLIILIGTTGCFLTLLLFLIPLGLNKIATDSENLPMVTKLTVSIASFIQMHATEEALLSVIITFVFGLLWYTNRRSPWLLSIAWNIPVIGDIIRKNSLQRFSLALSTLLSCEFDLAHALTISASELRNTSIEKRILHVLIDNFNGSKPIFAVLKELSVFSPLIIEMAKNEKSTSHSIEHLKKIFSFYQLEVEAAFNAFAIIIGPLFVSVFGLLSLGVLISVYLPVFKLVGNP